MINNNISRYTQWSWSQEKLKEGGKRKGLFESLHVDISVLTSKPWHTSLVMAPEGPSFYAAKKRDGSGHRIESAVIYHFQKAGLVGKWEHRCLVCCQTLDNLIRDLIN